MRGRGLKCKNAVMLDVGNQVWWLYSVKSEQKGVKGARDFTTINVAKMSYFDVPPDFRSAPERQRQAVIFGKREKNMVIGQVHDEEIGDISDGVGNITSWCWVRLSVRRLKPTSAGTLSGPHGSDQSPCVDSKTRA